MKYLLILFVSFLNFFLANNVSKAAEKININFEEMTIPLTIEQISNLETYNNNPTELIGWLKKNGFLKLFEFSRFLRYPIFKEEGLNRQVLRSWVGSKILSELSNTIIVPNDKDGIKVFNTIETLLESKKEVSTLEILKALPSKEISLDIDNLISIIYSWKKELSQQQNLIKNLNSLQKTNNKLLNNIVKKHNKHPFKIEKRIYSSHRAEPIKIELWRNNNLSNKELIIFMPGFGGSINNFRWIGVELSKRGWPVLYIDHKGSNSQALSKVLEGNEVIPSGADLFLNRLKDLDAVIKSHKEGKFELENKSYILMGHSLGALIAYLHEGDLPKIGFEDRCDLALKDFAITNLSKLIQCQLKEISIPKNNNETKAEAIVGFNTFGSLIWPREKTSGIDIPVLLIGGTYDLITPLTSEQFPIFLSTNANDLNRFLIVEGGSHFSPIRINNNLSEDNQNNDLFKIREPFIGANPELTQNLSIKFIIEFLENIKNEKGLKLINSNEGEKINYYIFDRRAIKELNKN